LTFLSVIIALKFYLQKLLIELKPPDFLRNDNMTTGNQPGSQSFSHCYFLLLFQRQNTIFGALKFCKPLLVCN